MRLAQRHLGQQRIAWLFLAPNLVIFGLFTFLPIILNFHYATTGGVQVLPGDRPYVGADNFETLLDLRAAISTRRPASRTCSGARSSTPRASSLLQVGCMVLLSLRHRARAQPRDPRARLLPQRVLLPGAAVAGGGRADLEVDPAARGHPQRLAGRRSAASRRTGCSTPAGRSSGSIFVSIWAHMGFYTLILLAGLQAIPKDVYEAAEMDGASPWRVFWRITLPLLMPNMLVVLVLALIKGVQTFDEIFVLTGGGPGSATTLIVQFIYETGFAASRSSTASRPPPRSCSPSVLLVLTLVQLGSTGGTSVARAAAERGGVIAFLTRTRGRRPAALDRLADLRLPAARHAADVRPGALARAVVVQDPGPAARVPAEPAALRPGQRRGRGPRRAAAAVPGARWRTAASGCWRRSAASASRRSWSTRRRAGRADQGQHRRPRAGARASSWPGATTPTCSGSSTSAATCGTACSSPSSRRSSCW